MKTTIAGIGNAGTGNAVLLTQMRRKIRGHAGLKFSAEERSWSNTGE